MGMIRMEPEQKGTHLRAPSGHRKLSAIEMRPRALSLQQCGFIQAFTTLIKPSSLVVLIVTPSGRSLVKRERLSSVVEETFLS